VITVKSLTMSDNITENSAPVATSSETAAPVAVVDQAPIAPAEAAPIAETAKTVETAAPVMETVLGPDKPTAVDAKSADASAEAPPEGEKKEEVSQSDESAPLPSYEPWKFPDGVEIDQAQLGEVNKMFADFEIESKADHASVQKFGQQILDRHVESVQAAVTQIAEAYQKAWTDQANDWHQKFLSDPEIGGAKKDITSAAARDFVRRFGGSVEQQNSLLADMQRTGFGNHPDLLRALAKAADPISYAEGKAIPAGKPPAPPTTRKDRFYGPKPA
jgi:hypothetical protein